MSSEFQPVIVLTDLVSENYSMDFINAFSNVEKSAYTNIARSVSSKDSIYIFNDGSISREDLAKKVAKTDNALVIGMFHYYGGLLCNTPDTDYVTFDSHNDAYLGFGGKYANGSFLAYRKGTTFVLGTSMGPENEHNFTSTLKNSDEFIDDISENIVLSLDVDCYDSDVTSAFRYSNVFPFEKLRKKLFGKVHFSEKDVLDLSSRIVSGRNVNALDVSEYFPFLEVVDESVNLSDATRKLESVDTDSLPTVDVLKRYLTNVCEHLL